MRVAALLVHCTVPPLHTKENHKETLHKPKETYNAPKHARATHTATHTATYTATYTATQRTEARQSHATKVRRRPNRLVMWRAAATAAQRCLYWTVTPCDQFASVARCSAVW